jgi:hypothetical protein
MREHTGHVGGAIVVVQEEPWPVESLLKSTVPNGEIPIFVRSFLSTLIPSF